MSRTILVSLLASAAWLPPVAVAAQDHHQPSHPQSEADVPPDIATDEIVVAGHPPIDFGLLEGSVSLEGDDLVAGTRGQIGDTLAKLPGVSASSFAPGVSRPVLRGFDGDRIRVLTDGIGSIDASSVSADHAVVFDALTIDHIDILHGPATLLFGGQAIGGAVNALDKRIPRRVPQAITVTAIGGFGSAASERSAGAAVDFPLAPRFVAHIDANWRESDDLRIGGFVNSESLRSELLAAAAGFRADGELAEAEEFEELAAQSGRLPNSAARSSSFGAGLAFIDSGGNLGVSVQRSDSRYGVPLRPGSGEHGGEHGHGNVTIDLAQTRIDLRGEVDLGGLLDSLQFRGAYGDYSHVELEGDAIGTSFAGRGFEFRADLIQADRGGWRGRSGVQVFSRKLEVEGEEAVFPNNTIDRFGLFTLQSYKPVEGLEIEAAGRFERATINATTVGFTRSYALWSGALGASWKPREGWKLGVNWVRGARAPAPEELLSDGLHIATQAFELGDPAFAAETSNGYEAYLRFEREGLSFALTGYRSTFPNFIAARPTGNTVEGFPEFRYTQLPARFQGFEATARWEALGWGGGKLILDAAADYTHAELTGGGPVPRIPPLRLRGSAELELGSLHIHGEVEWNARQNRVAAGEAAVPGFTLVGFGVDWHPLGDDGPLTLLFSAENLFNVTGRRAASFTRDFVPLPGRDLRITAKLAF